MRLAAVAVVHQREEETHMKSGWIVAGVLAALAFPVSVSAQGVVGGAQQGANKGAKQGAKTGSGVAGPVGGAVGTVVGGTAGAVTGGVQGALGVGDKPKAKKKTTK
jgi:hypothetical protein